MRRKCKWCGKVKAVAYHNTVTGDFFCSCDCMRKANSLRFLANMACERCGNPIRMNGVVQRRHANSDLFYCSEKCALEDIGIVQDADVEGNTDGS